MSRRSGGWPLTMFLTPGEHTPFFGGTYFPREAHYGLPSFKEVLIRGFKGGFKGPGSNIRLSL
jgi:uncharacterized protein YyaL (SSP411 family)